jgi:drug/metabolite transporter (DMT)-like permease
MSTNQKPFVGIYLELHFIVVLLGFTAILGKMISISSVEVVLYRTLLASLGIFFVLFFMKKKIKISKSDTYKMLATGLIVAFHWFLFFYSARVSNVSISLVGLATATFWVAILQPIIDKTRISITEVGLGLVVIFGLYLIFQTEFDHWWGLFLSVLTAFFQAVFSIINSKFTKKHPSLIITFYEMAGACFFSIVFLLIFWLFNPSYNLLIPSTVDWLWIFILAIVCTVYAYSAIVRLLGNISAFSVNLAVNLEPIYGIILAYFIFGESEKMSFGFYAGTLTICLAVFGYQILGKTEKVKITD